MNNFMKNWKSTLGYFLFTISYGYVIYTSRSEGTIWNVGILALLSMALIMARSKGAEKLIDAASSFMKSRK